MTIEIVDLPIESIVFCRFTRGYLPDTNCKADKAPDTIPGYHNSQARVKLQPTLKTSEVGYIM